MPNAWTTERLKVLLDFEVGGVEQEDAVGRVPVASGAPDLLNILLQRAGALVMQNVADVRLVDAHAESARRDHDQTSRRIHELTLCCVSIGSTHLPVIARDWDTRAAERAPDLIDRGGRGAIDDARPSQAFDAPGGGAELLRARHNVDGQAKVLAVSRCDDHPGFVQAKPFGDILPDAWRCRCREGKHRRIPQALPRVAETQVGGPEVVPPFRDAVGLIDAQKRRPRAFEQGSGRDRLERLGRCENDEAATPLESLKRGASLGGP